MKELQKTTANEEIYKELETLVMQIGLAKKLFPSALCELAKNSGIELGKHYFRKPISKKHCKTLVMAKLEVDKINSSIKAEYGQ